MANIKHSFTAGKMNKDLDQRLVPQGEYRSALNIQVRTTSGDENGLGDSGTVQNLQGNKSIGTSGGEYNSHTNSEDCVCVGSIADEKNDCAYFLYTTGTFSTESEDSSTRVIKQDTIVRQFTSGATDLIFLDRWGIHQPMTDGSTNLFLNDLNEFTGTITQFTLVSTFPTSSLILLRENMSIDFYQSTDSSNSVTVKIKKISGSTVILYDALDTTTVTWANITHARITHPRVLNFQKNNIITGLNIIDDLLFFTDGVYEPKKINVKRCFEGTNQSCLQHTQLVVSDEDGDLELAGDLEFGQNQTIINNDILEKHITVLRPAPKTPPTIDIDARDLGELQFTTSNLNWFGDDGDPLEPGDEVTIGLNNDEVNTVPELSLTSFRANDIIRVYEDNSLDDNITSFKVKFLNYVSGDGEASTIPTNEIKVEIITFTEEISINNVEWSFEVELPKPKFELKFARFGYRYKYEDGEYSAFSPFSEVAFDPGVFDYDSTKGFNLGMVNTIQNLAVKDFIPYYTDRDLDISEVDILYKSTNDANVYVVKTVKKEKDQEWEAFTPSESDTSSLQTGRIEITSDTIHRVLPSNQILRAFDNVPRYAKAQEITGSRIIYGNYVQGFDINRKVSLSQVITSETVDVQPKKSIKTLRDYKVGMVFGDKYGRETPVIESSSVSTLSSGNVVAILDDLVVEKTLCDLANKIKVKQTWFNIGANIDPTNTMSWMEYVKYYIKETSNEYYNLVLDRWYYARNQDNIWLSFPSADRNKVDLETYLILKKDHGENVAVLEAARYKVIDIDNEAPEFIKLDLRDMGVTKLGTGNHVLSSDSTGANVGLFSNTTLTPNSNEPDLLTSPDAKEIIVPEMYYSGFLDNYGTTRRGELFVRVVGRTIALNGSVDVAVNELNSGDFIRVTHHYKDSNNNLRVGIEKSFGATANMFDAFKNANLPINDGQTLGSLDDPNSPHDLQYFLEFQERVVENKPEFDGRFFVLIEKDFAIEKHVEKFEAASDSFVEIEEFKIGYVDTQQFNPALNGPYSNSSTDTTTWSNTGLLYGVGTNNGIVGTNSNGDNAVLVDDGAPNEWWGWGYFDGPEVGFFALGCEASGAGGVGYADATATYWYTHRRFHSSEGDVYASTNEFGFSVPNRIFLDGARATRFDLREFDNTNTAVLPFQTNDKDLYPENGISMFNYKPTALDQGDAESGLGRMVLSQIKGPGGVDQDGGFTGSEGAEILDYFLTEGTYFQFKEDTTGIDGKPNVYQVVHREIDSNGNEIFLAPEKSLNNSTTRNYAPLTSGATLNQNYQGQNTNFISTDLTVPASESVITTTSDWQGASNSSGEFINGFCFGATNPDISPSSFTTGGSGSFGGENEDVWNDAVWQTNIQNLITANNAAIDAGDDAINDNLPSDIGLSINSEGIATFKVNTLNNDGDNCFTEKFNQTRICGVCNFTNAGAADDEEGSFAISDDNKEKANCGRFSIRFQFRKVNPETGQITNEGINVEEFDPRGLAKHDGTIGNIVIQIMKRSINPESAIVPEEDRSVWETEPKEDSDLDIYYEASHAIPMKLKQGNTLAFAPLNSKVGVLNSSGVEQSLSSNDVFVGGVEYSSNDSIVRIQQRDDGVVTDCVDALLAIDNYITFTHSSGLVTRAKIVEFMQLDTVSNVAFISSETSTGYYKLDKDVYKEEVKLGWHNCYSFGNGVESDRIRDDFNAPQLDNGVRVSTTIDDFGQENKTNSLIYSGLYNTTSGVNDLNEFNMGEKIIKDLNPEYGSVQALKTRQTDVVVFCEDKILKVLANKDAIFNADGNTQLTATNRVLGQISTFLGDYGISKNPESLASDQYRMYFTDKQRGAVLRLSRDGLTPISSVGMKSWFRNNLINRDNLIGSFDKINGEYNLTIKPTTNEGPTISFNEASKGWVSFKSFDLDQGVSVSGNYFTTKLDKIYRHYDSSVNRNNFYDNQYQSSITIVFNDAPGQVKSFKAMNYEGSQARVNQFVTETVEGSSVEYTDGEYYNLTSRNGWWVNTFETDMQSGSPIYFKDKENKWFNKVSGRNFEVNNYDTNEFTVQGIGVQKQDATFTTDVDANANVNFTIQNYTLDDSSNNQGSQGSSSGSY